MVQRGVGGTEYVWAWPGCSGPGLLGRKVVAWAIRLEEDSGLADQAPPEVRGARALQPEHPSPQLQLPNPGSN